MLTPSTVVNKLRGDGRRIILADMNDGKRRLRILAIEVLANMLCRLSDEE